MPTRYTKQNEIQQLQYEITNEIHRDAPDIAQGVFGNNARHPDMASVSNQQLDDLYRQKYLANDRQWLQAEARRDPDQFEQVTDRIGVVTPQPQAPGEPAPMSMPEAVQQAMTTPNPDLSTPAVDLGQPPAGLPTPAMPPSAAPPVAPVMPQGQNMAPYIPARPVILGPSGQPLPPSGAM